MEFPCGSYMEKEKTVFIGKRIDTGQEIQGYYVKLNGACYILPLFAETFNDFNRVREDSIRPTDETIDYWTYL